MGDVPAFPPSRRYWVSVFRIHFSKSFCNVCFTIIKILLFSYFLLKFTIEQKKQTIISSRQCVGCRKFHPKWSRKSRGNWLWMHRRGGKWAGCWRSAGEIIRMQETTTWFICFIETSQVIYLNFITSPFTKKGQFSANITNSKETGSFYFKVTSYGNTGTINCQFPQTAFSAKTSVKNMILEPKFTGNFQSNFWKFSLVAGNLPSTLLFS